MNSHALKALSTAGQFLTVFPFVVCCEGLAYGKFIWWHYLLMFAVFGIYYVIGRVCAAWALSPARSRSFRPKAIFLSKAALAVPIIISVIAVAALQLSSGLYLYILPAAIIMYHGGYSTLDKGYSDIFTRGWFAVYFVTTVICSLLLSVTHDEGIKSAGGFQLCAAFGVLIVIAAVLTNQTNIDICTHQRDNGKTVLPKGLRAYNSGLVAAVVAVIVALFLFVKPLVGLVASAIKWVLGIILAIMQSGNPEFSGSSPDLEGSGGIPDMPIEENGFASLFSVILIAGLLALIIVFRKQLLGFIKGLCAPMFRVNEQESDSAYTDELSTSAPTEPRSRRKHEQQLYKQFRSESDPIKKYRFGYRLMLLRLCDTSFPPVETDNTDIHRIKGENGLRREEIPQVVETYNAVRYSGKIPTQDEINHLQQLVEGIRRKL